MTRLLCLSIVQGHKEIGQPTQSLVTIVGLNFEQNWEEHLCDHLKS